MKISENLESFPLALFELADTLEYLDLSSNKLSALPDDFDRFKKLKIFFASENLFTIFPQVLAKCEALEIIGFKSNQIESIPDNAFGPNLRWLILTNNSLRALPGTIGQCERLQKLMLAGNQLTTLPVELSSCINLGLLRISANRLVHLPDWLLHLPNLAWLAFAGNNFEEKFVYADVPNIDFQEISLGEMLGEGASGTIYRASRKQGQSISDIAVKVFKGEVTSDGYPEQEMNAYIAAGDHQAIVSLIGKINLVEERKEGLVMELIPMDFFNLGRPPSLQSCTRDVFSEELKISLSQLLSITRSMASVGMHLHSRGLLHGDLYAHNILINENGETLFGDFGAASFYNKSDLVKSTLLEKIEVKAYGYLLDDLCSICSVAQSALISQVKLLAKECLHNTSSFRPNFEEIVKRLETFED